MDVKLDVNLSYSGTDRFRVTTQYSVLKRCHVLNKDFLPDVFKTLNLRFQVLPHFPRNPDQPSVGARNLLQGRGAEANASTSIVLTLSVTRPFSTEPFGRVFLACSGSGSGPVSHLADNRTEPGTAAQALHWPAYNAATHRCP